MLTVDKGTWVRLPPGALLETNWKQADLRKHGYLHGYSKQSSRNSRGPKPGQVPVAVPSQTATKSGVPLVAREYTYDGPYSTCAARRHSVDVPCT